MTTLFVINPNSRSGDMDCNEILEVLSALGPVETHRLGEDGSLEKHIHRIGSSLKRIVVAGGDGTLNGVLPVVLDAQVPLGVLPLGTANDFARSLELPTDPVEAARLIAHDQTRKVDVGVVNDKYFLNAVGVGLGPELTKKLDKEAKKRLGVLAYLKSLIEVMGDRGWRAARITVDGKPVRTSFMQITVANGRHYGGGLMVSDEVEMDDGLLHILCVRPLTPLQLFLRGLRIRTGAVEDDDKLIYMKGRIVEIRTRKESDVTADGELITQTPIRCRCLRRSLPVYVERQETSVAADDTRESAEPEPALQATA